MSKSKFAKVLLGSDFRVICPDCGWTIRFQYDENTRFLTECQGCGGQWILTMNRYAQQDKSELVPPWASPTEKGVQCHACGTVYPSIESFDAHLTSEGKCGGYKPESKAEPLYGSYD